MDQSSQNRTNFASIAFLAALVAAQLVPAFALAEASSNPNDVTFDITSFPASVAADTAVLLTVTASDASYHEGTQLAVDGGSVSPGAIGGNAWSNGVASIYVTISAQPGQHTLTVGHGHGTHDPVAFTLQDGLASVTLAGPDTVPAGSTTTYQLSGHDASGNALDVSPSSCDWTAPTVAGPAVASCTTATTADPGTPLTGTKAVTVVPAAPASLAVVPSSATLTTNGHQAFTADATDAYGNVDHGVAAAWSTTVGSIDASGVLAAPSTPGTGTVTATYAGLSATSAVTVNDDIIRVSVSGATSSIDGVAVCTYDVPLASTGAGATISATGSPCDGATPATAAQLQSALIKLKPGFSDVTVRIILQPGTLAAKPDEVGADIDQELAGAPQPVLFVTIEVKVGDTWLAPGTLSDVLDSIDIAFDVPATFFTDLGLDESSHFFVEYSGGNNLGHVAVTELSPSPTNGAHHYEALFTKFSSFAFIARKPVVIVPTPPTPTPVVDGGSAPTTACQSTGLARVEVLGPYDASGALLTKITVGQTVTFRVIGYDNCGTIVSLSTSSFQWTAPLEAGQYTANITLAGVNGGKLVLVLQSSPVSYRCEGPISAFVGAPVTFATFGVDQYDNKAPLDPASFATTFDQLGPQTVYYKAADGQQYACGQITVFAGHGIIVTPDQANVPVGGTLQLTATVYDASGHPLQGAAVTWAASCGSVSDAGLFTAPTKMGVCQVTATRADDSGVSSAPAMLTVVHGPAATLDITGPDFIVAGAPATFIAVGVDAFGDQFKLDDGSFSVLANEKVGPQVVTRTIGDATGSRTVTVTPDKLTTIAVGCPAVTGCDKAGNAIATANTTVAFPLSGTDRFDNPVTLAKDTLEWQAPLTIGKASACYSEQGVQGCRNVDVQPSSPIERSSVAPASAGTPLWVQVSLGVVAAGVISAVAYGALAQAGFFKKP